ncbi:MAG: hypothetical protein M3461_22335 [Pseudomonadota bacterium]|nr:hypothetical protein [Pseudomonadota bacterium]
MLGQRPDLTLVKLADGAKDNWSSLGAVLPQGIEIIDFYHACEHRKAAFDAAFRSQGGHGKPPLSPFPKLTSYPARLTYLTPGGRGVIVRIDSR